MKILKIFYILFLFQSFIYSQPHINITFENREISGNTWTFDLVAQILPTYVGVESNWSTMDIRTNISNIPSGATISSVSGTPTSSSVLSATGQTGFAGGGVTNTVKYAVALERNVANADFTPGTTVTLASMSVTFSDALPASNLVTPRTFGSSAQSFWTTTTDPTPRPFGLPAAFPLPITIKSFSATKDGERTARLDWTSSSEINSDFIAIERSTDGEDWTTVGQVKAAGNSNRDIDYIYYDRSLPMARSIDNIFYYRLKLTDLDGQYKYSETRGVNMGRLEGLVSIYPNPATDIINVDLTDMDLHEGIIHLSVYDNTGKAIISKEVNGAGIEPIQASNMAAGSYQVVVKQGDTTHRKQIIVVN